MIYDPRRETGPDDRMADEANAYRELVQRITVLLTAARPVQRGSARYVLADKLRDALADLP